MYLQQGRLTLCKLCIVSQKGHSRAPGMVLICKNTQASFTWSRVDLARLLRTLRLIDFRPSWIISFELVSPLDSFLQPGRLYWFLYLLLYYFYDPSMFIFCWSSNFVENVLLEREHGGQDSIWHLLPSSLLLYRM